VITPVHPNISKISPRSRAIFIAWEVEKEEKLSVEQISLLHKRIRAAALGTAGV